MRMPRLLDKPYKLSLVCHLPLCWGSAELSVIALVWVMDWSPVHSASYLFLVLVPVTSYGKVVENVSPNCRLIPITPVFQYEYYQEGDIIIGGLVSAHDRTVEHKTVDGVAILYNICAFLDLDDYKAILAFIFAIEEINQDPDLLPNITLGYHIFDTCADPKKTLYYTFRILSGKEKDAPNYSCMAQGEVAAFVGDSGFPTTHAMAQLLNLYKYTQINYEITNPLFNDKELYPTFYRVVPDDWDRYRAIIQCLKYLDWNWIGIITPNDESGEIEYKVLRTMMAQHKICVEFVIELTSDWNHNKKIMANIGNYTTRALLICGLFTAWYIEFFDDNEVILKEFTLILHESWLNVKYLDPPFFPIVNGSLIFMLPKKNIPNISTIINEVNLPKRPVDPLLQDLWLHYFHCLCLDEHKNILLQFIFNFLGDNCTKTHRLPESFHGIKDTKTYYTYTVAYVLAHAIHTMNLRIDQTRSYKLGPKINNYLKKVHYTDHNGEDIFFNEKGQLSSPWLVANWVILKNGSDYDFVIKPLASFERTMMDKLPNINEEEIIWKNGSKPQSRCNDKCSPGYRKAPNGGYHVCCYDCVPCSEGEFSNITDSETCRQCPEDEWPDEEKVNCIPKTYEFLSYETDILVAIFSVMTVLLSIITLFTLGSFIRYWDTPIVKANNRTVSFILLVSIFLSFFCVFLFLGCPMDITCLLRQTLFGIFFSISVSSVLGKTITVCIAFKATKPGSSWVKWVSFKVSNYVVVTCSSVQILLCVMWLLVSPPYVEFDHHSYPGKIVIQCNEGSDLWFYSMLGYMGLLAAVSFLLAFMVRTLPDSFNEAKYITFSMLLFCSVWMAMIPTYLSTRGKSMVAVEIFAILTSCAGVLGCIFVPKLYIMVIRPEFNTRKIILQK
ncbi:vomeronasal type-2 receptor 26-like [Leptodactylus fuscus]|uniref:vomeronasal type-2 receptor 26-like n=1 Tax=Leptodactylus fuscus TaxID=238119 RepID=UPI003F4E464B